MAKPAVWIAVALGLAQVALVGCDGPGTTAVTPTPDVPAADVEGDSQGDSVEPDADAAIDDDTGAPAPDVVPSTDITVGPPDVGISQQPLAGVCALDDDCLDGWCNADYPGGYCSVQCDADADCPDGAKCYPDPSGGPKMCWKTCQVPWQCRKDQFCGGGLCTPKCQPDSCNTGYLCNQDTGQCVIAGSVTCEPADEVCDGADNDCDDVADEGCGPELTATPTTLVADLGLVSVGGGGLSKTMTFTVSSAAASFEVIVQSADGSDPYMAVYELTTPSGQKLIAGGNPFLSPNPAYPGFGLVTVLVPNTPAVDLESGVYKMSIYADGPESEVWVKVVQSVRSDLSASTLDVNFWFVGLPGLDATKAAGSNKFQQLVAEFQSYLAEHGLLLGKVQYLNVTGTDAQKYSIVDTSADGAIDEHAELLKLSGQLPATDHAVNFFFVQGFTGWGLLGKAGGIPGPPLHGTTGSGVVVSLADYFQYEWSWGIPITAHSMFHELGHQLGLYHTTEQSYSSEYGWMHDPIPDSPECENDSNQDGIVDLGECTGSGANNVMFWSAHFNNALSDGQRFVLHRNPSVTDP